MEPGSVAILLVAIVGIGAPERSAPPRPRPWRSPRCWPGVRLPAVYAASPRSGANAPSGGGAPRRSRSRSSRRPGFAKLALGSFLPSTFGVKRGDLAIEATSLWGVVVPMLKIIGSTQGVEVVLIAGALVMAGRQSRILARPCRFPLLWCVLLPAAYALLKVRVLSRYLLLVTPFRSCSA
jgi:hypothetical protein